MKSDFLIALTQLAAERHLPREQVLKAVEVALASAFRKDNLVTTQNISVKLNPNSGEVAVFATKSVVEEVEDPLREMTLDEARAYKPEADLGDEVVVEALPHQVSRIAAQTAKQVVLQRLREVERELVFQEFAQHIEDVVSGVVDQFEGGRVVVLEMGRAQAVLPPEEQVPTERYRKGQRLKVYVLDVRRTAKGPEIVVSRTHRNLLKRLFEIEVPEVYNGIVEIKSIARESGFRSKVAVSSRQDGIDPVGSCIGMRGNRIQSIVNELQGEKIDVVRWDKDPKILIANALSPSEVIQVELNEKEGSALVAVPERQLSLAIGKEGQNARLAAKLTDYRLDIKSLSEWETIRAQRHAEGPAKAEAVALAEPAVDMAVEAVAEAPLAEVVEQLVEVTTEVAPVVEEAVAEPAAAEMEAPVADPEASPKLSPEEELALLALEMEEAQRLEAAEEEEEEGAEEGAEEGLGEDIWQIPGTPVVTPGAGSIRFAEDIMGEIRGGRSRRQKRTNRRAAFRGPARPAPDRPPPRVTP